jgi:hypothetical protein
MDKPECNYINPNVQNAQDMNLNCINNPSEGLDKYCLSEYKLYDNIAQRSVFLDIKRGTDAGYGIVNKNEIQKKPQFNQSSDSIEGFTGQIFIGPDGPGKRTLTPGKCPQGYSWCNKSHACKQVCMGCKYEDNMKSQEFNESDPCFPQGVYDGRENDGTLRCTCGNKNQYCSDNFVSGIFNQIGLLLS